MKFLLYKLKYCKVILCFLSVFITPNLWSQSTQDVIISNDYDNLVWTVFVEKLAQEQAINIFFTPNSFPNFRVVIKPDQTLKSVLENNLKSYNLSIAFDLHANVFITEDNEIVTSLSEDFFDALLVKTDDHLRSDSFAVMEDEFLQTRKEHIVQDLVIGSRKEGRGLTNVNVQGYLRNKKTNEPIVGATLYFDEIGRGVATDKDGFFKIRIKKDKYTVVIRSLNYAEEKLNLTVLSDGEFNLYLDEMSFMLKDVVISAIKHDNVKGSQMGYELLTIEGIKEIPLVFGEADIVKVALMLPGIQSVGEGSAGINVRGSPADQNLFYINNAPIYNASHLSGFFSAFNSDGISEFALLKSNIPVSYGGRLSSIFEIKAKDGNKQKFTGQGGISTITGRLLIEGPIAKDKSSYLIGVRSSYSNMILGLVKDPDIKNSNAKFADALTNFSIQLNPKNQLNIFSYYSFDNMDLYKRTEYDYENIVGSLSWKHTFNSNHFFEMSMVHSQYKFSEDNEEIILSTYSHKNELQHNEFKTVFNLNLTDKHKLTYGINAILYQVDRGNFEPLNESSLVNPLQLNKEKGLESSAFISDEWNISEKLSAYFGIRANSYSYLGPNDVFEYRTGYEKTMSTIVDTLSFANNKPIATYNSLDFRASAKYLVNDELSVKVGYNTLHQNIFILSNTIALSPNDKWKLSDNNITPMKGEQITGGIYKNFLGAGLETSLEVYYKRVENLVEIKDGADILFNEFPEQNTLPANLKTYGVELMIKKPKGKINGWLNYTYSKSKVKTNGLIPENNINFGITYPSNFDRPHALNIVANYNFSRRFSTSANLVYSTGRPITYPSAVYYLDDVKKLHYTFRNEYRIPDYFRIDLSFKLEGSLKRNKLAHGSWIFSIYNLTGRNNAYSVFFKNEEGKINGYKLSIFGSPIVSLTYNFKLGNYAD